MQNPKTRDVIKRLREHGYGEVRITGGHAIYGNGQRSVPVPVHNVTVNGLLARAIFKEISTDVVQGRDVQGQTTPKVEQPRTQS